MVRVNSRLDLEGLIGGVDFLSLTKAPCPRIARTGLEKGWGDCHIQLLAGGTPRGSSEQDVTMYLGLLYDTWWAVFGDSVPR